MSAISDFMSGLPSYNADNFSRYSGPGNSNGSKRPSIYVPTTESPSEILIVNDKTDLLLRYIHRKTMKEEKSRKRSSLSGCSSRMCPKKRRKLEALEEVDSL